jgi:hypothetical protein
MTDDLFGDHDGSQDVGNQYLIFIDSSIQAEKPSILASIYLRSSIMTTARRLWRFRVSSSFSIPPHSEIARFAFKPKSSCAAGTVESDHGH